MDLTREQRDLLGSYEGGPRIWDAASIVPTVFELTDMGLIETIHGQTARQLTELGRQVLAEK